VTSNAKADAEESDVKPAAEPADKSVADKGEPASKSASDGTDGGA
jgi:hypothetical protein